MQMYHTQIVNSNAELKMFLMENSYIDYTQGTFRLVCRYTKEIERERDGA